MKDTESRYGPVSQAIHWLTVALFMSQIAVAIYMEDLPKGPAKLEWYALHKSIGFTILSLVLLRMVWRLMNEKPPLPMDMKRWQQILAHGVQHSLYLVMVLMPISGLVMSWAANYPVSIYGMFTLPNLVAPSESLKETMIVVHEIFAWSVIVLISLHVAGALNHHFVIKDNVLRRMLPGTGG
jgi:cytochrome b561